MKYHWSYEPAEPFEMISFISLFKQSILKEVGGNINLLDKIMASITSNAAYQESKASWKMLYRYTSTEKNKNMLIIAKNETDLQVSLSDLQYICKSILC